MPAVVLSDRMSCLKNGVVANVVVPHPDYARFGAHFGFRPDFCESADPESKGVVEHLAGYVQVDLWCLKTASAPTPSWPNRQARAWGLEVNGRVHSETQGVPSERLQEERLLMRRCRRCAAASFARSTACRRSASARPATRCRRPGWGGRSRSWSRTARSSSGSTKEITHHQLKPPGGVSIHDQHYSGPVRPPARAIRVAVRTETKRAFIALGRVAEGFLRLAAAAGTSRLAGELA